MSECDTGVNDCQQTCINTICGYQCACDQVKDIYQILMIEHVEVSMHGCSECT